MAEHGVEQLSCRTRVLERQWRQRLNARRNSLLCRGRLPTPTLDRSAVSSIELFTQSSPKRKQAGQWEPEAGFYGAVVSKPEVFAAHCSV
jgi:hypothetical protein